MNCVIAYLHTPESFKEQIFYSWTHKTLKFKQYFVSLILFLSIQTLMNMTIN